MCINDWTHRSSLVDKKRISGVAGAPRNHLISIMSTVKRLPMSMLTVLPDVIPTVKCDCDPHLTNRLSIGHIPGNDPQSSEVPADDTIQIEQVDDELPAVKYMREIGYWPPPKYPSFKK